MVYDKYASNEHFDTFIHVNVKESNIDQEVYELCNRVFDSNRVYFNEHKERIEQVIDYINVIFKDYDITGMIVHIKSKNNYTSVTIKDKKVINYDNKQQNEIGDLTFKYDSDGVKLECSNNNIIFLEQIEKEIITIYKEIFGAYPDLSKEEDYKKIQSMMWIVDYKTNSSKYFGDYTIRYNGKPTSCKLKSITDKIVPFGQTDKSLNVDEFKYIELDKNLCKIVKDYISGYKDEQEILDNIALTSYIIDRMVTKYYEIEDIVDASKSRLNYEQAEEINEFLTNLNTSLQSTNPYVTYKELEKDNKSKIKVKNIK